MNLKTKNDLPFENRFRPEYGLFEFKVGTVVGLWESTDFGYCIIAIFNKNQGNGHLDDMFQWFENSCHRDKKDFLIIDLVNEKFKNHLIEKKGFKKIPTTNSLFKNHENCKKL